MQFKGVIFDFNGTLLWDTALHNRAWDIFLQKHNLSLTDQQKDEKIHGRNNELIFPAVFGREMSVGEISRFVSEKESIYRELCMESGIDYAPGAVELIGFLKDNGIAVAIATASGKENVDFYIDYLKLDELIDKQFIVYNDGRYKSKPDPDIFLAAMKLLGLKNSDVAIFEDSIAGITAALRAKPGRVYAIHSLKERHSNPGITYITDFNQVERAVFR